MRDCPVLYRCYNPSMAQINLHVTPGFEADLAALMKGRGLKSKSEAIRIAVREAAAPHAAAKYDLRHLIGLIDRLPGRRTNRKSGAALLKEIDDEMEVALAPPRRTR